MPSALILQRCLRRTAVLLTAIVAAIAVVGSLPGGPTPAQARTRATAAKVSHVPQGFVGVDIDGPLFWHNGPLNFGRQMTSMVKNGVQSVRVAFDWATAQPYASWADVPSDQTYSFGTAASGRPISFAATDAIVRNAAERGLTVLPTILYAPSWDASPNGSNLDTPSSPGPFADYATELVKRYGPNGTFWQSNDHLRYMPIHAWQIWNEPNISFYWPQPFASGYVKLLQAAHDAIKRADPHATVVLAALTNYAWRSIGQIYKIKGAGRLFDTVAVNGFTANPSGDLLYLRFMRNALNHFGARHTPIIDTEFSWPSGRGQALQHPDFSVSRARQASYLSAFMSGVAAQRRRLNVSAIYYYSWIGNEYRGAPIFNFSGLLDLANSGRVQIKPAQRAYRTAALKLEGCRSKGSVATVCHR